MCSSDLVEQRGTIEVKISDKAVSMARIFAVLVGKDMVKKRFSVGDENGTDNGTDNGNAEA